MYVKESPRLVSSLREMSADAQGMLLVRFMRIVVTAVPMNVICHMPTYICTRSSDVHSSYGTFRVASEKKRAPIFFQTRLSSSNHSLAASHV